MQDEQKTRAELLQELDTLRSCVSKLTQVETKLKQYQFMVESAHDAIFFKDLKSRYVIANNRTSEAFGLPCEQVIGKNDYEIMRDKDEAQKNIEDDNLVFKTGKPTEVTKHMTSTDGKERWFQAIKVPQFDDEGKIVGLIGIARDITDRKRAEEVVRESERKYRGLAESLNELVYRADPETLEATYVNNAIERLYGYSVQEWVNNPNLWEDSIHPDDKERVLAEFAKARRKSQGTIIEYRIVNKDKEVRWVEDCVSPERNQEGEVVSMNGVMYDITERKRAQEQIRKLSSAVEQSIDGLAIGDLEPRLLFVNDAFARMHGYTREEMMGMPVTKLFNKEQMHEYKKAVSQQETQDFWEGEIGHIKKDGTAFLTYVSVTVLKDNQGKPTGTLAVARDITEHKRGEKELNTYREKMARAERLASMGTLSAALAHELTQPLTVIGLAIGNSLAELEKTSCPGTAVEDLKEGLSEIASITSMVERFRNFAKMSTKRTVSEVDFKAIAERIVKLLDESAWRAKVTLQVEGMDKLPLIYSYERDLEQLFFSLIENAIQAADRKEKHRVIISGAVREGHIVLQFSDNCGGIAPEHLDTIFEPFFTTRPKDERTGLGLCVVERIVSELGGKVQVESTLGKGSTFFVTLPMNKGER